MSRTARRTEGSSPPRKATRKQSGSFAVARAGESARTDTSARADESARDASRPSDTSAREASPVFDAARILDCLAAAYRLDVDGPTYLQLLLEHAVPLLDHGLGVITYTYDASASERTPPVIGDVATSTRFDPAWLARYHAAVNESTDEVGDPRHPTGFRAWGHLTCGQASAVRGMRPFVPLFAHLGGARDAFALNALDASGQGLWLGVPLPTTERVPDAYITLFSRLAAHLTAAVRLRRMGGAPKPAAVMSPRGQLLHVEPDAGIVDAREQLRSAALDFERARTKRMRKDADAATRRWRPLVTSRWSLLDDFDSDGRRFVVAVENGPPTRSPKTTLSERELQVVTQASLGHTNKEIAYELGLSDSTVRVLLHRAATKLGAIGRAQLLERLDELTRADAQD